MASLRINRQLVATFSAVGSAFCDQATNGSLVQELWPGEPFAGYIDDIYRWSTRNASSERPILRYFLDTGDWRVMQVADIPRAVAPTSLYERWIERGKQWGGVQHQIVVPLRVARHGRRAFVVARPDRSRLRRWTSPGNCTAFSSRLIGTGSRSRGSRRPAGATSSSAPA